MKSIAVIDSGSGGLTVANRLFERLPGERIIYVGDHGNCPYGNKSEQEIKEAVFRVIRFLGRFELKMLVVACNTATALMLDELKEMLDFPVIGVIEPGAEMAAGATQNRRIGVIATRRTAESRMYEKTIKEKLPGAAVFEQACPKLVDYLENDETLETEMLAALEEYLAPLRSSEADTLVMGCTHYPLAEKQIRKVWGGRMNLVDPALGTAERVREALQKSGGLSAVNRENHLFFTTGEVDEFSEKVKRWTPVVRPVVLPLEN
ncbi:glutamate racemase [Edaphobacillus lindanitolerans]|uniref:Glutamate racemase n=1 Tax=Edaphobacillus lindanitolerans TaxID=550447 RepID=A0A1U7PL32_9BACI|nr:glutamate racemase [Edaphobacillus lindanitolerans]SIT87220.1 glutamate racemase [Edaphobacillus lindanitolerans]